MTTHKQFWIDPYQTCLDTTVVCVEGAEVELSSTIFFAFAGGQERDHGHIAGHEVLQAVRHGAVIRYTLASGHGLQVGQTVRVEIDGLRRYRLMRLHFAAEVVLELAGRHLPGLEKIGAHISADKARIDFLLAESISPHLPALEAAANAIVAADLPIRTGFEEEGAERRYWLIEGFSLVACGGTHVRSTGEVGAISLKRRNVGKGKERIEIFVADAAS